MSFCQIWNTTSNEQSGAVEACWAHNPEVRRSKLRSAISLGSFLFFLIFQFIFQFIKPSFDKLLIQCVNLFLKIPKQILFFFLFFFLKSQDET